MDDGEKIETKPRALSPINGQPVPGGRPKGVPNKATTQFKEALNTLFEYSAPHMVTWLEQIPDAERRFDILAKFAEYLYPKLARTELTGRDGEDLKIIWPLPRTELDEIRPPAGVPAISPPQE